MTLLLAGCARAPLPTPGRPARTWDIAVAVATGERRLEALYTLATEPVGRDVWRIATVRTSGKWEAPGGSESYDSAAPTPADPWPLTFQHLVAAVPADVRMEDGRAAALVDPEGWAERARAAISSGAVPAEAHGTGDALVDAEGLLADLRRTFPGVPAEGQWVRAERIAGVDAERVERCTATEDGRERSWECAGTASSAEGAARLFEVSTWTKLAADPRGLVWLESGYSGTLVALAPGGHGVLDRPIAGLRRVERR